MIVVDDVVGIELLPSAELISCRNDLSSVQTQSERSRETGIKTVDANDTWNATNCFRPYVDVNMPRRQRGHGIAHYIHRTHPCTFWGKACTEQRLEWSGFHSIPNQIPIYSSVFNRLTAASCPLTPPSRLAMTSLRVNEAFRISAWLFNIHWRRKLTLFRSSSMSTDISQSTQATT